MVGFGSRHGNVANKFHCNFKYHPHQRVVKSRWFDKFVNLWSREWVVSWLIVTVVFFSRWFVRLMVYHLAFCMEMHHPNVSSPQTLPTAVWQSWNIINIHWRKLLTLLAINRHLSACQPLWTISLTNISPHKLLINHGSSTTSQPHLNHSLAHAEPP